MGGDGGTCPGGRFTTKTKKRKLTGAEISQGLNRVERWQQCAITSAKLRDPVVCDGLGNLYNKDDIFEKLLEKRMQGLDPPFHHIQRVKDLIHCNITFKTGKEGMFICPFSRAEGDGNTRFVCVRKCGCIFSRKAMEQMNSSTCLVCGKPLVSKTDEWELIPLFGTEQDQSMILKNEQDNEIKIKAQENLIQSLRRQIDILKSCMQ